MSYNFKTRLTPYVSLLRGVFQKETWQHLQPCDVLLVRNDNDCGYTFHGQAYAQIIDSFGDLCENRGLVVRSVATPHSKLIGKQAYRSPVSYDRSFCIITIMGGIVKIFRILGIGRNWSNQHQINLWHRILEKATPKYIIGIQPDKYLCKAGRIKQIPVFDLQHGVISEGDYYYGGMYRKETPVENLPAGFLCWDEISMAIISKWAHKKEIRVIKTGNPWFLRYLERKPDDLLVKEVMAEAVIPDILRPRIVVSLQWGMAKNYPEDIFSCLIGEALEQAILDTLGIYDWILRLHPVQLRDDREREMILSYLNATFGTTKTRDWIRISEFPLPVVLSHADLHITYSSSTVTEAAWMGIRSGLLGKHLNAGGKYEDLFTYERSIGMAEVIPQDADFIKKWIADTLAKGRGEPTMEGSEKNLNAFIDEIVGMKS